MRLNFDRFGAETGRPLLIAHGLLGSARNWQALARRLARRRPVVTVDMRNHGDSPWSDDASYPAMAADLAETIAALGGVADVLGHSMGGKAAMALALTRPEAVGALIVADIAPVGYDHSHAAVVEAMARLDLSRITRRAEADAALAAGVPSDAMRAFVLTNLALGPEGARWRPNLAALGREMPKLVGWPEEIDGRFERPALFLRGGASDYVTDGMRGAIQRRFPAAEVRTLPGAGHWLHAEQPGPFVDAVEDFLGHGGENHPNG